MNKSQARAALGGRRCGTTTSAATRMTHSLATYAEPQSMAWKSKFKIKAGRERPVRGTPPLGF